MFIESFKVESPNVKYTETEIQSVYNYETTELVHENKNGTYQWVVKPKTVKYEFKTNTHVPKLGLVRSHVHLPLVTLNSLNVYSFEFYFYFFHLLFYCFVDMVSLLSARVMLVGWGGNNGSTLTGGVIANRELVSSSIPNH